MIETSTGAPTAGPGTAVVVVVDVDVVDEVDVTATEVGGVELPDGVVAGGRWWCGRLVV